MLHLCKHNLSCIFWPVPIACAKKDVFCAQAHSAHAVQKKRRQTSAPTGRAPAADHERANTHLVEQPPVHVRQQQHKLPRKRKEAPVHDRNVVSPLILVKALLRASPLECLRGFLSSVCYCYSFHILTALVVQKD